MKILRYIVFLTAALAAASCMKPFDLKLDDEPIIYLEAFPGVEDVGHRYTTINIHYSITVNVKVVLVGWDLIV